MGQPTDSTLDRRRQIRPRRILHLIELAVLAFVVLGALFAIPYLLFDAVIDGIFSKSVVLERMGWRFEAEYEGVSGITTNYSKLTYRDKTVGQSLPKDVNLVTSIGEFVSGQYGWGAAWSDPQIWDDAYRLPEVQDGERWVKQIDEKRDIKDFLAQRFYQAPAEVRRYGVPWTDQQLKGTPAHWVYVYRLSWRDPEHDAYSSHAVRGYWVDPAQLDGLTWE